MSEIFSRVQAIEEYIRQQHSGFSGMVRNIIDAEWKKRFSLIPQSETYFGLIHALVADTKDIWKQGRIRYFTPLFHPSNIVIEKLPWAFPISNMGGFDDSGLVWTPPAGSTISILFENGNRNAPFYFGTVWPRSRKNGFGIAIDEYEKLHRGHRGGYILGNDEKDVLPPWNTESYNGIDVNSPKDIDITTDAYKQMSHPNIYGFKTPQKHMLKMVDGDYDCGHKHKRIELLSSCGNWMLFKDDHMREFKPGGGYQACGDATKDCNNQPANSAYFKHKNELRPWEGVKTPQNNKCSLKQSGIQILSISGHTMYMDDSVDQPQGTSVAGQDGNFPGCPWEKSMQPFNFGCNNKCKGKFVILSSTGHRFEMSDDEEESEIRSKKNFIKLLSACGNKIELNDHSISKSLSGSERGIHMQSTSNHTIDMVDEDLSQSCPTRMEGGTPSPKAKKAYIKIRSGYGLEIIMNDKTTQEACTEQYLQLFAPQKKNPRGPHIVRLQEKPSGPGLVYLQVGGNYVCVTYDNHETVVGRKKNPSDWMTFVSRHSVFITEKYYLNAAYTHLFKAKKYILLMAGEDCGGPDGELGACVWPVLCMTNNGITISDRVFVSASKAATPASIFQLLPFHQPSDSPTPSDANALQSNAVNAGRGNLPNGLP